MRHQQSNAIGIPVRDNARQTTNATNNERDKQ